jgi:hypothetical protein
MMLGLVVRDHRVDHGGRRDVVLKIGRQPVERD